MIGRNSSVGYSFLHVFFFESPQVQLLTGDLAQEARNLRREHAIRREHALMEEYMVDLAGHGGAAGGVRRHGALQMIANGRLGRAVLPPLPMFMPLTGGAR